MARMDDRCPYCQGPIPVDRETALAVLEYPSACLPRDCEAVNAVRRILGTCASCGKVRVGACDPLVCDRCAAMEARVVKQVQIEETRVIYRDVPRVVERIVERVVYRDPPAPEPSIVEPTHRAVAISGPIT